MTGASQGRRRGSRPGPLRRALDRKRDGHERTTRCIALGGDGAVVQFDGLLANGQPQSGAPTLGGEERVKHLPRMTVMHSTARA